MIKALLRVRRTSDVSDRVDGVISHLLSRCPKQLAAVLARELMGLMLVEPSRDPWNFFDATLLDDPVRVSRRTSRAVGLLLALKLGPKLAGGVVAALDALPRFPIQRCRLTVPELVELLKLPTCTGATRRAVLDRVGNAYGRRFVNHWEFVAFARERKLDLDFTSPPRWPDPAESLRRMNAVLQTLSRPESEK